jgi:hypothetical protein
VEGACSLTADTSGQSFFERPDLFAIHMHCSCQREKVRNQISLLPAQTRRSPRFSLPPAFLEFRTFSTPKSADLVHGAEITQIRLVFSAFS